jgi:hypothetical protein
MTSAGHQIKWAGQRAVKWVQLANAQGLRLTLPNQAERTLVVGPPPSQRLEDRLRRRAKRSNGPAARGQAKKASQKVRAPAARGQAKKASQKVEWTRS